MRLAAFALGTLAVPLICVLLPLSSAQFHTHVQVRNKAAQQTASHTIGDPNTLPTPNEWDHRSPDVALKCIDPGAQCKQFPPAAPSNDAIWVRVYCSVSMRRRHHNHSPRRHSHRHLHRRGDENKGSNDTYLHPKLMYPCPQGTHCHVKRVFLDRHHHSPLLHRHSGQDGTHIKVNRGTENGVGGVPNSQLLNLDRLSQQAADNVVTVFDTLPEGVTEEEIQEDGWWDAYFTCGPDDQEPPPSTTPVVH